MNMLLALLLTACLPNKAKVDAAYEKYNTCIQQAKKNNKSEEISIIMCHPERQVWLNALVCK